MVWMKSTSGNGHIGTEQSSVQLPFEETLFSSIQHILRKNSLHESNFYVSQGSIIFINRMATLKEFLAFIQLLVQFRNIRRHYFINTTNIYLARIPSINPA